MTAKGIRIQGKFKNSDLCYFKQYCYGSALFQLIMGHIKKLVKSCDRKMCDALQYHKDIKQC